MISELFRAGFIIFMAEMGDKTQILAMTFATQYAVNKVLLGIFLGSLLNHGLAVVVGFYMSQVIPLQSLRPIAALAFIGFGYWTLVKQDDDETSTKVSSLGPMMTVAIAFFVGELGDKTQLAAITIATGSPYPLWVLAGTVSGMVVTSSIGIFVGSRLGKQIPESVMKIGAALIFLFFGSVGLYQAVPAKYLTITNGSFFLIALVGSTFYLIRRNLIVARQDQSKLKRAAEDLRLYIQGLRNKVNKICLGANNCHGCDGKECIIGFTKESLALSLQEKSLEQQGEYPEQRLDKAFSQAKAGEALAYALLTCQRCNCDLQRQDCVIDHTRRALERIYFGEEMSYSGSTKRYLKLAFAKNKRLAKEIQSYLDKWDTEEDKR